MTANPQGPVRVVPVEPTEAMLDAFWHGEGESAEMRARSHERGRNQWSRMLAAAPSPAAPEGVEGWRDESALVAFVRESNRIEGIHRDPTDAEIEATNQFMAHLVVEPGDLDFLVDVMAPGHRLRDKAGLNVRVGNHVAPRGGPDIPTKLADILALANSGDDPFEVHRAYETLHPFTDGNGRSGRALWLWMMIRQGKDPYVLQRGFLHTWYYQSLAAESERQRPPVPLADGGR